VCIARLRTMLFFTVRRSNDFDVIGDFFSLRLISNG
jgi:hypothetical protein